MNRGRSDRILPQRDMADSILYGGRKGKRRETLARSIVVSRLNRENCLHFCGYDEVLEMESYHEYKQSTRSL